METSLKKNGYSLYHRGLNFYVKPAGPHKSWIVKFITTILNALLLLSKLDNFYFLLEIIPGGLSWNIFFKKHMFIFRVFKNHVTIYNSGCKILNLRNILKVIAAIPSVITS
jgi:hypothetical protein